ncbi:MAG: dephospho-CoA kinase [Elusimicrobiota bacterium]
MLKVAITGNICTGKTSVSEIFRETGIPVVSCDELVRGLQNPGNVIWARIRQNWQDIYFNSDLTLNREKITSVILEDPGFKLRLEEISHPLVRQEVEKIFRVWEQEGIAIAACEVPLLYEAGWDILFDKVVLTYVAREVQVERIIEKKRVDLKTAEKWLNIQDPPEGKKARADLVIDTGTEIKETKIVVEKFIEELQGGNNR